MIIIGLFSKGRKAVHFSWQGMTNIYMRGQERVMRQRLYYPRQGSCGDEASVPFICWGLSVNGGRAGSSRELLYFNASAKSKQDFASVY